MIATLGILLAGGAGTRLAAGVPKALVSLAGTTLLARTRTTLATLCDAIVVVAPASIALPDTGDLRICDPEPGEGPLAAVLAALAAQPCERALVLGIDFPLLTSRPLAALGALQGDAIAVLAAPGGVPQPLAAWYAISAHAPLAAAFAAGERSLVRAIEALGPRIVAGEELAQLAPDADAFLNVNTPAELAHAAARLAVDRTT